MLLSPRDAPWEVLHHRLGKVMTPFYSQVVSCSQDMRQQGSEGRRCLSKLVFQRLKFLYEVLLAFPQLFSAGWLKDVQSFSATPLIERIFARDFYRSFCELQEIFQFSAFTRPAINYSCNLHRRQPIYSNYHSRDELAYISRRIVYIRSSYSSE